jgi:transposase
MLARIDRLTADIDQPTRVIERLLAPFEEQLQQAGSMPGWGRRAAQDTLAETRADMTRFPTGAYLASWASRTPVDHQSGARKGRARAKKGNRYLAGITGETAVAAGPKCSAATEKASAMVMASRTAAGSWCPPAAAVPLATDPIP